MLHPGDRPQCLRRLWLVLSRSRVAVIWAVMAGLFLMHGAASTLGCCSGGTPATAITVTAAPGAFAAGAGYGTAHSTTGAAAGLLHPAVAGLAAYPAGIPCDGQMLCSSRQPQGALGAVGTVPPAVPAVLAAAAPAGAARVAPRPVRPPGRPGLPLPLFLGVSRT